MALDGDGFFALGTAGLDDVGVNRALRQPLGTLGTFAFELGSLLFKHGDEFAADDLAFGFGVAHTGQLAQEQVARIGADHLGV